MSVHDKGLGPWSRRSPYLARPASLATRRRAIEPLARLRYEPPPAT